MGKSESESPFCALPFPFVMLNLFQHPLPRLRDDAWTLKQVQGDEACLGTASESPHRLTLGPQIDIGGRAATRYGFEEIVRFAKDI